MHSSEHPQEPVRVVLDKQRAVADMGGRDNKQHWCAREERGIALSYRIKLIYNAHNI